jgi:hypothetical protein
MSRNNGKRRAAISYQPRKRLRRGFVDSEEEPEYNVDWLPEARSVFVVPFTEFYNSFAECPKGTCTPRNWRQQHREGVLVGTKRHNNAQIGLTHGIQFEGDARASFYPQVYEWEEYCLGPSLSDADAGSEHGDSDVSPVEGGSVVAKAIRWIRTRIHLHLIPTQLLRSTMKMSWKTMKKRKTPFTWHRRWTRTPH